MRLSRSGGWMAAVTGLALVLMLAWSAVTAAAPGPLATLPPTERSSQAFPVEERIDINTATAEELTALPGIGEARAQAIVDYREANGPFRYPEDLIRVRGIGEGTVNKLLDYVTTGGGSDAENLSG